jgi:hypothetical protein
MLTIKIVKLNKPAGCQSYLLRRQKSGGLRFDVSQGKYFQRP